MARGQKFMGRKFVYLFLVVTGLVVASGAYIIGGTQAYSRYQQANVANQRHCGGQSPVHVCVLSPAAIFSAYYPSYLTAKPQSTLFTVEYSSDKPMTLFLHVSIEGFTQTQTRNVKASATAQTEHFLPPLIQGTVLENLTQETNTSLRVQVSDASKHTYYDNDSTLTLHSRWLMQWTYENRLRVATWVTPGDAAVTDMVNKAEEHLQDQQQPVPSGMIGYRGVTSLLQVKDQVNALYDTLRLDYHIKYVQESVPYVGADTRPDALENIKLPKETLKQGNGMCIELTALLASAVERIGLHPEIVIVPGHAFLGVALTEDDKQYEYWDAVDVNDNIAADSANVQADKLYKEQADKHAIIDFIVIGSARAAGIGPML